MLLLVGLGNPGRGYQDTRHNIGFQIVESIASSYGFSAFKAKFHGLLAEGIIGSHKVMILKPLTFMNNSGLSVYEAAKFYKIPLGQILVFHDDLDLATSKIRVKIGGGHGGHNGLRSIDASLGKEYVRIRIGIDHPGDKDLVSDYVLSNFSKAQHNIMSELSEIINQYLPILLAGDYDLFMSRVAEKP